MTVHHVPHRDDESIRIAVDDFAPSGPRRATAVFLPGFGSVRRGEKATRLASDLPRRGKRFVALDFQGLGDSNGEFRSLTLRRQLGDYESVRDALLLRQKHVLIGSSMGGLVAAMAAAKDRDHVAGLVLLAPAFGFRSRFEQAIGPKVLAEWERTGSFRYRGEFFEVDLAFELLRDARTVDEAAIAGAITQPVLLMHGDQDATVPIEESEKVASRIRAPLEFVRLANGSHRMEKHLGEIVERIDDFIERLDPR